MLSGCDASLVTGVSGYSQILSTAGNDCNATPHGGVCGARDARSQRLRGKCVCKVYHGYMESYSNLSTVFQLEKVNQTEFEQTLLSHFSSARELSETEIVYPGNNEAYALRLVYDDATLVDVKPGPQLKQADVDTLASTIQDDLLTPAGTRVGAAVLFALVPTTGCFRYRDVFQLLPVPPDAPRPSFVLGDHPLILEFTYDASAKWTLNHSRRAILGREWELFLNGVVEGDIHSISLSAQHHWVLLPPKDGEEWNVDYCQEMYIAKGVSLDREVFTAVDNVTALKQSPLGEYYARSGIEPDQQLELPANIVLLCDMFRRLPPRERRRFLRAC